MADPSDLECVEAVQAATGREIRIVLVAPSELDQALARHYRGAENEANANGSKRRSPEDPDFLHHWSVSRDELLALLSEDPGPGAEPGSPGAAEARLALDRRRLEELDNM